MRYNSRWTLWSCRPLHALGTLWTLYPLQTLRAGGTLGSLQTLAVPRQECVMFVTCCWCGTREEDMNITGFANARGNGVTCCVSKTPKPEQHNH